MAETLFHKVWDAHTVRILPSGQTQLFVGLHLVHEVTSPQAFDMLRQHGWKVAFPERTFATVDHIVPTDSKRRPFLDLMAEEMTSAIEKNCREFGINLWSAESPDQGIVHVIGPQMGLTQPGMTIACGDSHTSTHGAVGAIAFGIGTSQVRDVLASQCLALEPLKVRRIDVNGQLAPGVYAKDVILTIIRQLGVQGGNGFAYEYGGTTVDRMTIDERMTVCNMSIEGGARAGYVNPDQTTFEFLRGRRFAPKGEAFDRAVTWWKQLASDPGASYDDRVTFDAASIEPTVTWGINPGQSVSISESIPGDADPEALAFMGFKGGARIRGTKIDVAFIGSCTNGRLSDLEEAARLVRGHHVAPHVKALVVPGSEQVARDAEARGLHEIFRAAGFEWRAAGCSMCLGMNTDKLQGTQVCASSSNRNFKGRQGSPTGRTLLMSPAMVAAAALAGEVADVREIMEGVPGMTEAAAPECITHLSGRGIPLRGNDIDTDRIMPARYLRVVSFEGLEQHLFEDDRKTNRAQHPFSDMRYTGASILIVNDNFGCGSSREHAPQGIVRAGIHAIVGESFSEIFLGNSSMLGLPCLNADHAAIDQLQSLIEQSPDTIIDVDVASGVVTAGALRLQASLPAALRDGFLSGQWNPTTMLLDRFEDVRAIAQHLPYVSGF